MKATPKTGSLLTTRHYTAIYPNAHDDEGCETLPAGSPCLVIGEHPIASRAEVLCLTPLCVGYVRLRALHVESDQ